MPCNCKVDDINQPTNEEWGPYLWRVLHTLAEYSGNNQTNSMMMADEMRAWPLFMKALPNVLPCPDCKIHLNNWIKIHPFLLPTDYSQWKQYIRLWLYTLHEDVNTRTNKLSFQFDTLSTVYKVDDNFKKYSNALNRLLQKSVQVGTISLQNLNSWIKQEKFICMAIGIGI